MADSNNAFKPLYKRFKAKECARPCPGEVLDLSKPSPLLKVRPCSTLHNELLKESCEAFELTTAPGLLLIRNPFKISTLRRLLVTCLHQTPSNENVCNLDAHHAKVHEPTPLWQQCWAQPTHIQALRTPEQAQQLFHKLSWATVGYHYDWTQKSYTRTKHTPFPKDFIAAAQAIQQLLGMDQSTEMQAGIVNYYHQRMSLGPHTDHSEFVDKPLISISLGLPALFQIGSHSLADAPTTLLLRWWVRIQTCICMPCCLTRTRTCSGDVVIMAQEARQAYHAVPRILTPLESETWFDQRPSGASCHATTRVQIYLFNCDSQRGAYSRIGGARLCQRS